MLFHCLLILHPDPERLMCFRYIFICSCVVLVISTTVFLWHPHLNTQLTCYHMHLQKHWLCMYISFYGINKVPSYHVMFFSSLIISLNLVSWCAVQCWVVSDWHKSLTTDTRNGLEWYPFQLHGFSGKRRGRGKADPFSLHILDILVAMVLFFSTVNWHTQLIGVKRWKLRWTLFTGCQ